MTCLGYAPGDKGLFKAPREVTGAGGAGGGPDQAASRRPLLEERPRQPPGMHAAAPRAPSPRRGFSQPPHGMLEQQLLELRHWWRECGGAQPAPVNPHFSLTAAGHEVRAGLGCEMWPPVITSPRAVCVWLPARKRDGVQGARRGAPPLAPFPAPSSGAGKYLGPALGEGQLVRTKPHAPSAPSFECPYLLSPRPARAQQTQGALLHTPNPSAPRRMSPGSFTQGAAGRCGCLNGSSLTICWEI